MQSNISLDYFGSEMKLNVLKLSEIVFIQVSVKYILLVVKHNLKVAPCLQQHCLYSL